MVLAGLRETDCDDLFAQFPEIVAGDAPFVTTGELRRADTRKR